LIIGPAPHGEATSHKWVSSEPVTHYRDWKIEFCTEEIFDCMSSGVAHRHATYRIIARKMERPEDQQR